jgi:hypothetical protein
MATIYRRHGAGAQLQQVLQKIASIVNFMTIWLLLSCLTGVFHPRRYGLLGTNGCGKYSLLKAIGYREHPIPQHMYIHHLSHKIKASDMSTLGAVMSCGEERVRLEKEAKVLATQVCFQSIKICSYHHVLSTRSFCRSLLLSWNFLMIF